MFSRWEYYRWRRRRRRRRMALLLIAAIVISAIAAQHGRLLSERSSPRATRTAPSATRQSASKTRHFLNAHARTGTRKAAGARLRWRAFHGIELPASGQDGPRHDGHGLAWGFADTPDGALLAAINIGVRTAALWGPAVFRPTIRDQVSGPGAAALLRADLSDYAALRAATGVRPGSPAGRGYAAEAGFRFAAYTSTGATVDVVTEGPGPGGATVMVVTRIEVIWRHGDWRVLAPPGGNWANSATGISSLTGYTTFANQG